MPIRGILLLALLIASLPICFWRPFYGLLLWTVLSILNPQSEVLYWQAALGFPWAAVVAVPTIAGLAVFNEGWMRRLRTREVMILVALWVWMTLTSVVSANTAEFMHHAADTWARWGVVSKILLMTLVTVALVDSMERLRWLMVVICGCFGWIVLKAAPFIVLTGGNYRIYGPEYSMIADNNEIGLALCMALPAQFGLARTEQNVWIRRLYGLIFLLTIPTICFTYSRGALLGLVVVLTLMFLLSRQGLVLVPVIVTVVCLVVAAAPASWKARMDPDAALDASAHSRFNAWTYSWRLAVDHPVFGGGFDTFTQELFDRYAPNARDVHGPHSIYFGVLAEHGFPGMCLYLSLIICCFWSSRAVIREARARDDDMALRYAQMLRFGLVGFLVSGAFLGRTYFDYFFTIIACITVLRRVCAESWSAEEEELEYAEEARV